jgi:hypothetical protein
MREFDADNPSAAFFARIYAVLGERATGNVFEELIAALDIIEDYRADFAKVTADKCAPDEQHCSCVPHLRRRIAELEVKPADSPTGTDAQPTRYTRPDGRETLDAIRDSMDDAAFLGFCVGNAIKYEDRTGKKGDAAEDQKKAAFYRQMAAHVRGNGPDPRHNRAGFVPYRRPVDHTADRSQIAALGKL